MKKIILLFLLLPLMLSAQTVYEPLHRDIYEYLGRLAQKGVIEFSDEIKPVSRRYIAEQLEIINKKLEKGEKVLTPLELEEFEFYKREFGTELLQVSSMQYGVGKEGKSTEYGVRSKENRVKEKTTIAGRDSYGRYRLFSYQDDLFKINVSPVLGYERGSVDGQSNSHRWNGVYLYGYLSDNIGFSFDFRDNNERGLIDSLNTISPETGKIVSARKADRQGVLTSIDYSEVRTHLTYSWDWGHLALGKEFMERGHAESGSLILSSKAPSFPFISYRINPAKWLQFDYSHSFLSSDVIDSTDLYRTSTPRGGGEYRISFRKKYFVSHSLIITPILGLNISLGESIIYSDNFEPIYTFPLMFFRLADHYLSSKNINSAGGNSQFFFGVSSRNHIKNTHLFGNLFIDEVNTNTFGKPAEERNQIGFTLGGSVVDLPLKNLKLTIEYTKIYPFVYMHYIPTQTYANASYNMGHWIGSNADLVYAALQYKILRGLNSNIWFQAIRKGEEGNPEMQHTMPQAPFLFGLRKNYMYAGAEVKYELTHELFVRGRFVYRRNEVQQVDKSFVKNDYNEFYFAVYYGL